MTLLTRSDSAVRASSRLATAAIATVATFCFFCQSVSAGQVTGVRTGNHGDYQRLVFDLRGTTQPVLTRVGSNEYELALSNMSWQVASQQLAKADLVDSIQAIPGNPKKRGSEKLRIKIKLTAAASATSRMLNSPSRLLIDMQPGGLVNTSLPPTVARRTPTRTPVQPTQRVQRDLTVIIDPGHGGRAPGAVGPSGVLEKDVVLAICKQLHRQLNAKPGIRALLTRDKDLDLTLQARVDMARDRQADLFVSVHADAITQREVRGGSVYVLSNNGATKAARRWAGTLHRIPEERRNLAGIDLTNRDATVASVLFDLVQTDTLQRSNQLASDVLSHLSADNEVRFKNVKLAELGVLKAPDIPSILVETAFISNPADERLLNSRRGQQRLASSITKGIERFARRASELARASSKGTDQKYQTYSVSPGDTLFSLARRFHTSVKQIRKTNALTSTKLLPGMVLRVPANARRIASRT